MKVPLNWLQEYVALPESTKELTDRLTAIGHMQDHQPVEVAGTTVLDLEVRQNRSDCLSLIGLAREVAAATSQELKLPPMPASVSFGRESDSLVKIVPATECYRFHAVRLDDLKIAPSPEWLVQRLQAYGIKTINNVVDITNFVMVEVGEPLHAFDRDQLQGSLSVRQAVAGESFTMLGDKTITLDPADIVIADDNSVVSLGGMIGGLNSGVSDATTSIILEAATYNQANIRRSSLRHSLRTEASLRHEKFLHTELTEVALKRAVDLLQTLAGAQVVEHTDCLIEAEPTTRLNLSLLNLQSLSGVNLKLSEAAPILSRLGFVISNQKEHSLQVTVPYFRTDVVQEEDVIEEVLRIHGYDQIPDELPMTPPPTDVTSQNYAFEEEIRDILVGFGFDEQITEPLTKESAPVLEPVVLQNSLNSEKTMLRTSLKPGLVAALEYQTKFRKPSILVFEIGRVYHRDGEQYIEEGRLGCLVSGSDVSLLTVKGYLEGLCLRLDCYSPTESTKIEMITPTTGYFEVDTAALWRQKNALQKIAIRTTVPQVVFEDLSLAAPHDVRVGEVISAVRAISPLLYRVELGEYPRKLSETEKSIFLKLQYHTRDGQIATDKVQAVRQEILDLLQATFKTSLR